MSSAGVRERRIKPVDTEEPGLDIATHEHGGLEKSVAKRYLAPSRIGGPLACNAMKHRAGVYEGHVLSLVCLITFSAMVDIDILVPLKMRAMALSMPNP